MPYICGRYMDPDEYADALSEARREEAEEALDAEGWTCESCGEMWDPAWVRATRTDPAYPRQDSCPRCGGDPVEDELGVARVGRVERDEDDDE